MESFSEVMRQLTLFDRNTQNITRESTIVVDFQRVLYQPARPSGVVANSRSFRSGIHKTKSFRILSRTSATRLLYVALRPYYRAS